MDFLADPVVDFLEEEEKHPDWNCVECGHGLTSHTRGLIIHDRCLMLGCSCKMAVLTEKAKRAAKHGLLP